MLGNSFSWIHQLKIFEKKLLEIEKTDKIDKNIYFPSFLRIFLDKIIVLAPTIYIDSIPILIGLDMRNLPKTSY